MAQPVVIQGTISSTTPVSVNNIPVYIEYADSSFTYYDTAITDTNGFYIDSINQSNITGIQVSLPSCTSTTRLISKSIPILPYTGRTVGVINFTNFCFKVSFSHWETNGIMAFDDTIDGGVAPYRILYDYGDATTDTLFDPLHSYPSPGTYQVQVVVTDVFGDTAIFEDSVAGKRNIPSFSHQILPALQVQFTNNSIGNNPRYTWDFGDTSTSTVTSPLHTYGAQGIYQVCLTNLDSGFQSTNTTCDSILVSNPNCQAQFSFNQTNTLTSFINQSSVNPPGSNLDYLWDFGDGSTSQDSSLVHIYSTNGSFPVTLFISNNTVGCSDSITKLVSVNALDSNEVVLAGKLFRNTILYSGLIQLIYGTTPSGLSVIDTMSTMEGNFAFPISKNSLYYLKALPHTSDVDFNQLFPTYYPEFISWSQATSIGVANTSVMSNDIYMQQNSSTTGIGTIAGKVIENGNQLGVAGVNVFATDLSGVPITKAVTDANGNYSLNGIPMGSYEVYPDIAGKGINSTEVSISNSQMNVSGIDFTIFTDYIYSIEDLNNDESVFIFPNPAKSEFTVQMKGIAMVSIYNQQGVKVNTQNSSEDDQKIQINIPDVKAGYYMLKIESRNSILWKPIVIVND